MMMIVRVVVVKPRVRSSESVQKRSARRLRPKGYRSMRWRFRHRCRGGRGGCGGSGAIARSVRSERRRRHVISTHARSSVRRERRSAVVGNNGRWSGRRRRRHRRVARVRDATDAGDQGVDVERVCRRCRAHVVCPVGNGSFFPCPSLVLLGVWALGRIWGLRVE